MIIVTGGAGFIGSNLVKGLNARGFDDILVVDDLTHGAQFKHLVDCEISDYLDKDDFLQRVLNGEDFSNTPLEAIFHQGACSATTKWDGKFMMANNYEYSKALMQYAQAKKVPFIYASSAAVYGNSQTFIEARQYEAPLNVYGFSKFQFDQYVRKNFDILKSPVVGLRYFNVYGPREDHKGSMASVAFHLNQQYLATGEVKLFQGNDGYGDGEQRRDFVYVDDAVDVNCWFLGQADKSGIYNCGTGRSQTFNDVANSVIRWHGGRGQIVYAPFPEHLQGHYQSFTQADISKLRQVGYTNEFKTVEVGIKRYLDWLNSKVQKITA